VGAAFVSRAAATATTPNATPKLTVRDLRVANSDAKRERVRSAIDMGANTLGDPRSRPRIARTRPGHGQ
jgi:hypothetical protein